jgi:hypothetical protein
LSLERGACHWLGYVEGVCRYAKRALPRV